MTFRNAISPFRVMLLACLTSVALAGQVLASESEKPAAQNWSFNGMRGTYDRAALQRGFQIYKEVCATCHSMSLLSYRNLGGGKGFAAGDEMASGPGFSEAEVKAIAAEYKVKDGPNDQGEMFERPARPSDRLVGPFANEQAARASNNGALPPDLSLMIKARENGADYVYALLTGYGETPADFKLSDGLYYNSAFPGHQIAMPKPLQGEDVKFADGTKATLEQEARDVVQFLAWAAEPNLEARHRAGFEVLGFLVILTGLFYVLKRRIAKRLGLH
ncbi:MAG: cytochrome c1 [Alphaproteobacteria bacterium]|nr:cytochrome c1 [Alphaproteobacteria bacterium]